MGATVFGFLTDRKRKLHVFTASLVDINKALAEKKHTDPRTKLPDWIGPDFYKAFNRTEAAKLPVYREGVNYTIELLRTPNGSEQTVP